MRAMLVATIGAIFLSGCVREDTESQFCRAVGARADGGVVLMDDVRLYVAGGVGHGAVVFDPACREQVSDLLIDYRPEAGEEPGNSRLHEFWEAFLYAPRQQSGVFKIRATVESSVRDGGRSVRLVNVGAFQEVSMAEERSLHEHSEPLAR